MDTPFTELQIWRKMYKLKKNSNPQAKYEHYWANFRAIQARSTNLMEKLLTGLHENPKNGLFIDTTWRRDWEMVMDYT